MWQMPPGCAGAGLPRAGLRWACAVALALVTAPAMLLAHLLTVHRVPSVAAGLLVTGVVATVAAALPTRSRAGLTAVATLAQASGHALLALLTTGPTGGHTTGCLPALGRGAEVGLRLALLRHDSACPPGTLAPGSAAPVAAAALLTAAFILAGHSVVAVLSGWLVLGTVASVEAVRRLHAAGTVAVTLAVPVLPAPRALLALLTTARSDPPTDGSWVPRPLTRRGPPLTCAG